MPVGDLENILLAGYDAELLELADRIGKPVTHIVEPYAPKNTGAFKMVRSDREAVSDAIAKFVIIGIDDPYVKQRLLSLYAEGGISPLDLIGGDIGVGSSWKPGLVHQFHSVITTNCKLGTCVKINTGAIVMHDADIGDFVSIAPRATLLGRVTVEKNAFIGANATILPDIKIGEGAVVGAGAVVTRDVAARTTVVGVPAKPMEKNDE